MFQTKGLAEVKNSGSKCLITVIILVGLTPACEKERDPALLYSRMKPALAEIITDYEIGGKGMKGWLAPGFFVSATGKVLTAAHQVMTTSPIVVVYQSADGTTKSEYVRVWKKDSQLDLALLETVRPIIPRMYFRLDLDRPPLTGQQIAVVTMFIPIEKYTDRSPYTVTGVLPATVFALLRDGYFATDIYAFRNISGSPVLDMTTERVIGVCVARSTSVEVVKHASIAEDTTSGTTVSLPVPYMVVNYALARSTFSAREFLSGLQ